MSDLKVAEDAIRKGSKSFSLAAMFFPSDQWKATCQVYHWCRYCDDVIDNQGDEKALVLLQTELKEILVSRKTSKHEAFRSLQEVTERYAIPFHYPSELLKGMEMDIKGQTYETLEELKLYCYRVASTVGLMMCYIMGLFRIEALSNAAHLGMAMQLTNIARDVKEDFENNRVYLPKEFLLEKNISRETLMADTTSLFQVVETILDVSDNYYKIGLQGVEYLPLRSAFVITAAAYIYREIGNTIRKKGPIALESRTVVSLPKKLLLVGKALIHTLGSLPKRWSQRNKFVKIDQIWSLS